MRRISALWVGVIWVFLMLSHTGAYGEAGEASGPVEADPREPHEVLWESFVTSGTPVRDAFIIGENIYIETEESELYCLDRENGHTKWIIDLAGPLKARPVKKGRNLLAVTASLLVEIDPERGHIVREERLSFSPSSGVALDDANYYLSGWDGRLYTLDQNTLKIKMTSPLKGRVLASPSLAEHLIICATEAGVIQAVNALDGTMAWLFPRKGIMHKIRAKELWGGDVVAEDLKTTDGTVILAKGSSVTRGTLDDIEESKVGEVWIYVSKGAYELPSRTQFVGQVEVRRGTIYAGTADAMCYCLRARGGNLLWHANLPGPAISGVIVRGDTIFVPTFESGVVALDRGSGKRKWWAQEAKDLLAFGAGPPAGETGKIYLLAQGDKIMVVEEASGAIRRTAEVVSTLTFALPADPSLPAGLAPTGEAGPFRGITNFDSQVLYLFTSRGLVIALPPP